MKNPVLPQTMTVRGRTYKIIHTHNRGETVSYEATREIGNREEADMGRDEGEHIINGRDDIPLDFIKIYFAFPDWLNEKNKDECVFLIYSHNLRTWTLGYHKLNFHFGMENAYWVLVKRIPSKKK